MRGLDIEHHLRYRQFVSPLAYRGTLAPFAGRQPVKRELFGMRFDHGYSVRSRRGPNPDDLDSSSSIRSVRPDGK
jgi:hypothetical protein